VRESAAPGSPARRARSRAGRRSGTAWSPPAHGTDGRYRLQRPALAFAGAMLN